MTTLPQLNPGKARATFNPKMWDSEMYVGEIKYDGARFLLHAGDEVNRFTSRHISKKNGLFVEKTENFPHLMNIPCPEGCVLDGEITFGTNSMSVTQITGAKPEKAINFQKEHGFVTYNVFDILFDKGVDIRDRPYMFRRSKLEDILSQITNPNFRITPVCTESKEEYYADILAQGGEGVILKNINSPYGDGWVKVKRKATYDVVITGYEEPTEITKKVSGEVSESKYHAMGWIGAIKFGQFVNGQMVEFGSCSGFDEGLRKKISENRSYYLGAVIEIEAQERIEKTGRFRHPRFLRFRDDKGAKDCVYRVGES